MIQMWLGRLPTTPEGRDLWTATIAKTQIQNLVSLIHTDDPQVFRNVLDLNILFKYP